MNQNISEAGEIKGWIVLTQDILGAKDISTTDKIVLAYISGFERYFASNETAAEFLNLTARTVQKTKQKLVRLGYMQVLKDTGRGKIYQFNTMRLSKYCQSDSQNFVNQTTNILAPYSKDYNKKNNIKGESPSEQKKDFGREDINELIDLWAKETGINIKGQQNQRRQLYNLVRKYGFDATKTLIKRVGIATHSPDRFAPQIATPSDLTGKYSKLPKLELWENRAKYARPFGTPAPSMATMNHKKGMPDYNGAWTDQTEDEHDKVSQMMQETRRKLQF